MQLSNSPKELCIKKILPINQIGREFLNENPQDSPRNYSTSFHDYIWFRSIHKKTTKFNNWSVTKIPLFKEFSTRLTCR